MNSPNRRGTAHPPAELSPFAFHRPTAQPLRQRNASTAGLPNRTPESRRTSLARAYSLQSPLHSASRNVFGVTPQNISPPGSPAFHSPPASERLQMSPHRKRLPKDSPVSQRRMRRRLFFEDKSDAPEAPEDRIRYLAICHEAEEAALAVIREAVENGNPQIDLSDLQLESVPDELAELRDLVVLTPSRTLATDLELMLTSNRLRAFPMAVCELTNLTTLIMSDNRISHLPPEIGNLVNLRELSVASNKLTVLPYELTKLANLEILNISANPLLEPAHYTPAVRQQIPEAERALRRVLAGAGSEPLRQFMIVSYTGVPRLADLAARHLTRAELKTYKHNLALCLENARPPIGRIVGPAVESSGNCVSAALKAQHLELPIGHQCAVCNQWFLLPSVEVLVWATVPLLQHRVIPFKVRLCSRNCLFTDSFVNILKK